MRAGGMQWEGWRDTMGGLEGNGRTGGMHGENQCASTEHAFWVISALMQYRDYTMVQYRSTVQ